MYKRRSKSRAEEKYDGDDDWKVTPEDANEPIGPFVNYDDSPLPPGMTLEMQSKLFLDMIQEAVKEKAKNRPPRRRVPRRPTDPSFLQGRNSAPPFQQFKDPSVLYNFDGIEFKGPKYFIIQTRRYMGAVIDLENDMTEWYNKFYFEKKMYERVNFWRVWIGGFHAAYIPSKERWVRGWAAEHVYSDDLDMYQLGFYDVLVYLIDYGVAELVPRRYVLPLRKGDVAVPFVTYIASIQWDIDIKMSDDEVEGLKNKVLGKDFSATICGTRKLRDSPYQVLTVKFPNELEQKLPASNR